MAITQTITALPTPVPSRSGSQTQDEFVTAMDARLAAEPGLVTEINTWTGQANILATAASDNAATASAQATTATTQAGIATAAAASAAASTAAQLWVSGTTYTVGYLVWSPANGRNYRRKVAGAGTTDPSADATNWTPVTLDVSTGMPTIRPALLLNFADTKQVDPRITFTRASSATYFDKDGVMRLAEINVPRIDHDPETGECLGILLEESRTNLLTYSEQFDNAAWTPAGNAATVTANNAVAPDGAMTADLIDDVSAAVAQVVRQVVTIADDATTYTFKIHIEKNTSRYVALWLSFSGGITRERAWTYDLDGLTSQADATYPAMSGTITDIGGGRRLLTITHANTTEGNTSLSCRLYPAIVGLGGVNVSATGSVWAWGAQLEAGLYASSYIPTTSATVTRSGGSTAMTGVNFSNWYNQDEGTFVLRASVPGFAAIGSSADIVSVDDTTANNRINMRVLGATAGTDIKVVTGGIEQVNANDQTIAGANASFIIAASYKVNDFAISTDGSSANTDTSGTIPTVTQLRLCSAGSAWVEGLAYYTKRLTDAELITLSTQ